MLPLTKTITPGLFDKRVKIFFFTNLLFRIIFAERVQKNVGPKNTNESSRHCSLLATIKVFVLNNLIIFMKRKFTCGEKIVHYGPQIYHCSACKRLNWEPRLLTFKYFEIQANRLDKWRHLTEKIEWNITLITRYSLI